MKACKTIILPRIQGLPPYAVDHKTGQKGIITIQKVKDIVFAAVLNDDIFDIAQDDARGMAINIIDRQDFERAKGDFDIKIEPRQSAPK